MAKIYMYGMLAILGFHLVANASMVAFWGGGLEGFFLSQWMGIPFFVDHILKYSVIILMIEAFTYTVNRLAK